MYVVHTIYAPDKRHVEKDYSYKTKEEALRHADILHRSGWKFQVIKQEDDIEEQAEVKRLRAELKAFTEAF